MQSTDPSALNIDLAQLYELIGYLTAENAALKVARAKDQELIQLLTPPAPDPEPEN